MPNPMGPTLLIVKLTLLANIYRCDFRSAPSPKQRWHLSSQFRKSANNRGPVLEESI